MGIAPQAITTKGEVNMGLEKLNPFRTKSYGGNAWEGRTGGEKIKKNNETQAALNEVKACSKCKKGGIGYELCKKHKKPKFVKAIGKAF